MGKSIGSAEVHHADLVHTLNAADTVGSGSSSLDAQHSLQVPPFLCVAGAYLFSSHDVLLCLHLLFFDGSFFMRSVCLLLLSTSQQ